LARITAHFVCLQFAQASDFVAANHNAARLPAYLARCSPFGAGIFAGDIDSLYSALLVQPPRAGDDDWNSPVDD
jgi:hypothetical protein